MESVEVIPATFLDNVISVFEHENVSLKNMNCQRKTLEGKVIFNRNRQKMHCVYFHLVISITEMAHRESSKAIGACCTSRCIDTGQSISMHSRSVKWIRMPLQPELPSTREDSSPKDRGTSPKVSMVRSVSTQEQAATNTLAKVAPRALQ